MREAGKLLQEIALLFILTPSCGKVYIIEETCEAQGPMQKPVILATPDVASLLKADRFTLNRLVNRFELEPSYGSRGQGKVLLFGIEDIGTIALVYWLFRSGLRTEAIRDALADRQFNELRQKLVSTEAFERVGTQFSYLVSWRVVRRVKSTQKRKAKGKVETEQKVRLARDIAEVQRILKDEKQFGFVVIPIGRLLRELAARIRESYMRK